MDEANRPCTQGARPGKWRGVRLTEGLSPEMMVGRGGEIGGVVSDGEGGELVCDFGWPLMAMHAGCKVGKVAWCKAERGFEPRNDGGSWRGNRGCGE